MLLLCNLKGEMCIYTLLIASIVIVTHIVYVWKVTMDMKANRQALFGTTLEYI